MSGIYFTCKRCSNLIRTMYRFHCIGGCPDFDLCESCYDKDGGADGHCHELEVIAVPLDIPDLLASPPGSSRASVEEILRPRPMRSEREVPNQVDDASPDSPEVRVVEHYPPRFANNFDSPDSPDPDLPQVILNGVVIPQIPLRHPAIDLVGDQSIAGSSRLPQNQDHDYHHVQVDPRLLVFKDLVTHAQRCLDSSTCTQNRCPTMKGILNHVAICYQTQATTHCRICADFYHKLGVVRTPVQSVQRGQRTRPTSDAEILVNPRPPTSPGIIVPIIDIASDSEPEETPPTLPLNLATRPNRYSPMFWQNQAGARRELLERLRILPPARESPVRSNGWTPAEVRYVDEEPERPTRRTHSPPTNDIMDRSLAGHVHVDVNQSGRSLPPQIQGNSMPPMEPSSVMERRTLPPFASESEERRRAFQFRFISPARLSNAASPQPQRYIPLYPYSGGIPIPGNGNGNDPRTIFQLNPNLDPPSSIPFRDQRARGPRRSRDGVVIGEPQPQQDPAPPQEHPAPPQPQSGPAQPQRTPGQSQRPTIATRRHLHQLHPDPSQIPLYAGYYSVFQPSTGTVQTYHRSELQHLPGGRVVVRNSMNDEQRRPKPFTNEDALPTDEENVDDPQKGACAICMDRPRNVSFLCGHLCCQICSESLDVCHLCRKPILKRIKLFL